MKTKKLIDLITKKKELMFSLFLLSMFLFRIPNFYMLPVFKSAFVTFQALARVLVVVVFGHVIFSKYLKNKSLIGKKFPLEGYLAMGFFLWQSASVLVVTNPGAFLSRYKDVVLGFLVFMLGYFYKKKSNRILEVLSWAIFFNLIYQTVMLLFRGVFEVFITPFIYDKHLHFVLLNLNRERLFMDVYDEAFLLAFLYVMKGKISEKWRLMGALSVIFFSLASNFRSRVLMLLVAGAGWIVIKMKNKFDIKKYAPYILGLVVIFAATGLFMSKISGFSYIDRLALRDREEDVVSLYSRWVQVKFGFEMSSSSLFGVGLGNYFDNLPISESYGLYYSGFHGLQERGAQVYVHNNIASIAAESGLVGLGIFLMLIFIYVYRDLMVMAGVKSDKKVIVVAFWVLFAYGFFNPIVPASYQALFWLTRGMLI